MDNLITQDQINTLKYLIWKSKNASNKEKKIFMALLDASNFLTKPVCIKMKGVSFRDAGSSLGTTHIDQVMRLITNFRFSDADICLSEEAGVRKYSHKLWLSNIRYDPKAKKITKKQVDEVELKDYLYP